MFLPLLLFISIAHSLSVHARRYLWNRILVALRRFLIPNIETQRCVPASALLLQTVINDLVRPAQKWWVVIPIVLIEHRCITMAQISVLLRLDLHHVPSMTLYTVSYQFRKVFRCNTKQNFNLPPIDVQQISCTIIDRALLSLREIAPQAIANVLAPLVINSWGIRHERNL